MKVLQKSLLARVVGGLAAASNADNGKIDIDGGASYGGGSGGGGYDANGVGQLSCVAAPPTPASGLFGLTLTETIGAGTAVTGAGYALGQAVQASGVIEAAGGFGAALSGADLAAGTFGSAGAGILVAAGVGVVIGTAAYHGSETVRDVAQMTVAAGFLVVEGVTQIGALILGIDRTPEPVFIP